jgi:ABC-type multidrug transport system fused ATPase/permease subunit
VYAKCLRLSVSARQRLPSGRITNLMTTDVAKICDFLYPQLSFIAVAPVAIFFSLLLLWFQIGWAR